MKVNDEKPWGRVNEAIDERRLPLSKSSFSPYRPFPKGAYPVQVVKGADAWTATDHRPRLWQIILVKGGSGLQRVGRTHHPLRLGDVFVLNDRMDHGYTETDGLELLSVIFDFHQLRMNQWETRRLDGFRELFDPRQVSAHCFRFDPIHFGNAIALIQELERCRDLHFPGVEMLVEGHFKHLVILLSRGYEKRLRDHDEASEVMAKAVAHLDTHYRQPIDMLHLAAQMGFSERTFYRLFKRATGMTPLRYLAWRRIEQACDLLRHTERPITQIAFESGFSDSNYFTRVFRQQHGEAPLDYRKRWAD